MELTLTDNVEAEGCVRVSYGTAVFATLTVRRDIHGVIMGALAFGVPEQLRGKGLATDAVRMVIAYGFARHGLNYAEDIIARVNTTARHVLEKNGFQETTRDVGLERLGLYGGEGDLRFTLRDVEHRRFLKSGIVTDET